jgi:hypothetical protein
MAATEPTLYYWSLKARGQLPVMILTAGKIPFKWEKEPGDYKSFAPFGQLPVLKVFILFHFNIEGIEEFFFFTNFFNNFHLS